ncbi:ATP-binding protein [Neolewinella lacunae]|uniref:ATP-binding protein n=1 Tax=Neolewinella lacunae TaxID=1517758 RepID=A0A923PL85_9BACT|nr:ATP-binding protein [Neolewinella lacunae]MBC6995444.1 ATP-binding protein [Neolewinella lacunae]MDN3635031.1 ATP-binding protein [Neolewinella lacunae]
MENETKEGEANPKKILGNPTKDLFVFILTRDLSVIDAINDLIDNSIDGAKRMRPGGNYHGLEINLVINEREFKIEDNCGGIPIDVARKYAFRFGRPKEMANTEYSIGQFGVGMKRAFFKLGKAFYVESTTPTSDFAIAVTIDEWLGQKTDEGRDDWSFEFNDDFKENIVNIAQKIGTKIEISPLNDDISKYVSMKTFEDDLIKEIESKHMENIYKGVVIRVNGIKLKSLRPEFLVSKELPLTKFNKKFDNGVDLEIICGVSLPKEDKGGWYIFCNDRLLLGPEITELTGWTGKGGVGVAHYHQQYWRFRGIVYFKSEDSYKLPWNTSKNNIDASSPIFLYARGRMIEMMRPLITFLNLAKKDNETNDDGSEKEYKPYQMMLSEAKIVELKNINSAPTVSVFKVPKKEQPVSDIETHITISYKKPKSIADKLRTLTNTSSYRELGEYTFDYYINIEEVDNE